LTYAITIWSTLLTYEAEEGFIVVEAATQDVLEEARKRLEQKVGLAVHWMVYLAVNVGLVMAAGGFAGSGWRIAGWGIGLAVHTGYVVFELGSVKERLLERELARGARQP
jgi:hypothetical protein